MRTGAGPGPWYWLDNRLSGGYGVRIVSGRRRFPPTSVACCFRLYEGMAFEAPAGDRPRDSGFGSGPTPRRRRSSPFAGWRSSDERKDEQARAPFPNIDRQERLLRKALHPGTSHLGIPGARSSGQPIRVARAPRTGPTRGMIAPSPADSAPPSACPTPPPSPPAQADTREVRPPSAPVSAPPASVVTIDFRAPATSPEPSKARANVCPHRWPISCTPRLSALLKEMRRPNRDARRGVPVDQVVTINALLGGADRRGAR